MTTAVTATTMMTTAMMTTATAVTTTAIVAATATVSAPVSTLHVLFTLVFHLLSVLSVTLLLTVAWLCVRVLYTRKVVVQVLLSVLLWNHALTILLLTLHWHLLTLHLHLLTLHLLTLLLHLLTLLHPAELLAIRGVHWKELSPLIGLHLDVLNVPLDNLALQDCHLGWSRDIGDAVIVVWRFAPSYSLWIYDLHRLHAVKCSFPM